MPKVPTILICDDQPLIHETLGIYLENEGFNHISAFDGEEAMALVETKYPDLIILDIMMPKMSGIEVCRKVRANKRVPIIMLTAKGEEIDKLLGLELGADDYIVKPFSAREVVARVKAVLRRFSEQIETPPELVRYRNLEININNYEVKIKDEPVKLTPKEMEILHLLASQPGKVFSREQILSKVWGYDYYGDLRAVDTQIKRIRQKIPASISDWTIKTVYGVGYKFEVREH